MAFVLNLTIVTVFTEDVVTGLESITVQTADDCNLGVSKKRGAGRKSCKVFMKRLQLVL